MGFDEEEKVGGKEVWSFSIYKTKASPEEQKWDGDWAALSMTNRTEKHFFS